MDQRLPPRLDTTNYLFYLSETRRQHLLKSVERARLLRLIRRDQRFLRSKGEGG